MKKIFLHSKGFTLIDILISTAIISFLSSAILFNVSEGKVKAQDSQMKAEAAQVATAIELYKTDNSGRTPISVWSEKGYVNANISTGQLYNEGTPEYVEIMNKLVADGYLSAVPKSPDTVSYAYGENTDGTQAVFATRLKSSANIKTNDKNSCDPITANTPSTQEYEVFSCRYMLPLLGEYAVTLTRENAAQRDSLPRYITNPATISCSSATTEIYRSQYSLADCTLSASFIPQICIVGPISNIDRPILCSPSNNPQIKIPAYSCPIPMADSGSLSLCDGSSDSDYCTCI